MASQATDIQFERTGILSRIGGFWEGLLTLLVNIAEANPRYQMLEKLSAMSDEELAKRGLKREELVRHVFRDYI